MPSSDKTSIVISMFLFVFFLPAKKKVYIENSAVRHIKDPGLSIMLHIPLNNRSLAPVQTKTITEACEA